MEAIDWSWARSDRAAVEELEWRMQRAAKNRGMLDYSTLVEGITFNVPAINNGGSFKIDIRNWRDIDRALIGTFLGYISMRSYKESGFLLSAIVVGKSEAQPSYHFFDYVRKLGMLEDMSETSILAFWIREFKAIHRRYAGID